MKLEHLAPYLPYGLKVTKDDWGKVFKMDMDGTELNCVGIDYVLRVKAKPILRPLSDLTKEIEHNGEKFVPFKKLGWRYMDGEQGSLIYCEYGESPKAVVNVLEYLDDYFNLLSWHFDVFGLIEKGEAIDINTL